MFVLLSFENQNQKLLKHWDKILDFGIPDDFDKDVTKFWLNVFATKSLFFLK